jgi:hypothetical protein
LLLELTARVKELILAVLDPPLIGDGGLERLSIAIPSLIYTMLEGAVWARDDADRLKASPALPLLFKCP